MPNTNPNRDEILKCPAKILIEDHSLRRYSANLRGSLCVQIMLHQRKCLRISPICIAWRTILYAMVNHQVWRCHEVRQRRVHGGRVRRQRQLGGGSPVLLSATPRGRAHRLPTNASLQLLQVGGRGGEQDQKTRRSFDKWGGSSRILKQLCQCWCRKPATRSSAIFKINILSLKRFHII